MNVYIYFKSKEKQLNSNFSPAVEHKVTSLRRSCLFGQSVEQTLSVFRPWGGPPAQGLRGVLTPSRR
jgi:hypothetical protein